MTAGDTTSLTPAPPTPVLSGYFKSSRSFTYEHNKKKCSDMSPGSRTLQQDGYKCLGKGEEGWKEKEKRVAERREGRREGERLEGKRVLEERGF